MVAHRGLEDLHPHLGSQHRPGQRQGAGTAGGRTRGRVQPAQVGVHARQRPHQAQREPCRPTGTDVEPRPQALPVLGAAAAGGGERSGGDEVTGLGGIHRRLGQRTEPPHENRQGRCGAGGTGVEFGRDTGGIVDQQTLEVPGAFLVQVEPVGQRHQRILSTDQGSIQVVMAGEHRTHRIHARTVQAADDRLPLPQ